jgi:GntR family transcriptional regulator
VEIRYDRGPIWQQIIDEIRRMIAARALRVGDAAPSVRKLAQELGVTPATVERAYRDLIARGVLVSKRGRGTFVCANARPASDREKMLEEAAVRFAEVARNLGAPLDEATGELAAVYGERASRPQLPRVSSGS